MPGHNHNPEQASEQKMFNPRGEAFTDPSAASNLAFNPNGMFHNRSDADGAEENKNSRPVRIVLSTPEERSEAHKISKANVYLRKEYCHVVFKTKEEAIFSGTKLLSELGLDGMPTIRRKNFGFVRFSKTISSSNPTAFQVMRHELQNILNLNLHDAVQRQEENSAYVLDASNNIWHMTSSGQFYQVVRPASLGTIAALFSQTDEFVPGTPEQLREMNKFVLAQNIANQPDIIKHIGYSEACIGTCYYFRLPEAVFNKLNTEYGLGLPEPVAEKHGKGCSMM
jgi:hypothetical protein